MGMFPYIGLKNRPALYMVGTSNLGSQIIFPERWLENQPNVCVFFCAFVQDVEACKCKIHY